MKRVNPSGKKDSRDYDNYHNTEEVNKADVGNSTAILDDEGKENLVKSDWKQQ